MLTSVDVAEEQLCVDSVIDDMLYEIHGEVRRQQRCAHSSLSELTVIGDKEKMNTISPEREELVRAQLTDRYRAAMRRNVTRREFFDRLMAFVLLPAVVEGICWCLCLDPATTGFMRRYVTDCNDARVIATLCNSCP